MGQGGLTCVMAALNLFKISITNGSTVSQLFIDTVGKNTRVHVTENNGGSGGPPPENVRKFSPNYAF